ncbi:mannose-1-phosphate guanylyltransferase, partial [Candidatus Peregrinibacteria bacterium]|nr:mannose-1-phosphate guanylyltransferase [Candidatus Peregrinibacteria bacterium]
YRDYLPKTHKQLMIIKEGIGTAHEKETLDIHYPKCDKISIDYGIMEKVDKKDVLIIPAVLGWSDVGTWESILEELPRDENGNLIRANHHGVNTSNSLVFADKDKLIATVGLDNLVIVDTDDVLLVCKKSQSQHVKQLVQELKETKHKELL